MPVRLRKRITRGFFAALLLMLAIGALSYRSIVSLMDDDRWVAHTQTMLTRLESLLSLTTDAEAGQRGYLITGDEEFLDPYHQALALMAANYAELRRLTTDNEQQQQQLDALLPLLDARLALLAAGIHSYQTQGGAAAAQGVASGQGKRLHDRIHQLVKDMARHETDLLQARAQKAAATGRFTLTIIVLGNLFGMALVALSLRQVLRDLKRREASEHSLQQANTELAAATARALQSDRLKSAFLAIMSHELRTPLNSIIGFTGILRQEMAGPINPEQTKQLDMVQASARHLLALINDVLDISKIEAGEMRLSRAPFDLHATIDSAVASVLALAQKKGLTC